MGVQNKGLVLWILADGALLAGHLDMVSKQPEGHPRYQARAVQDGDRQINRKDGGAIS